MVTCLNCGKELTGSKKRNKYCNQQCQLDYQYKQYIKRWQNGEETGGKGKYEVSNHVRRYLFEKYNCSCQKCGWNQINPCTGNVPLQVHHIDGDCLNNKEENLQLLCPNCHSLTDTFGNLNQKSSRIYRKQKENTQRRGFQGICLKPLWNTQDLRQQVQISSHSSLPQSTE